jgi:hypothetical protein
MACQTKGRRTVFRNRAGHALTGQYVGCPLDFAVSGALSMGFYHSSQEYASKQDGISHKTASVGAEARPAIQCHGPAAPVLCRCDYGDTPVSLPC